MNNEILIAIGHKARQGKDESAKYLSMLTNNSHVLHFADKLYEECKNEYRYVPLITQIYENHVYKYVILDKFNIVNFTAKFVILTEYQVPTLHSLMISRLLTTYWGMNKKDGALLQFWGTEFRRAFFGENYWVNCVREAIQNIRNTIISNEVYYIVVADLRFKNEFDFIESEGGFTVDIKRYDAHGAIYIDKGRDPNHITEIGLDNAMFDYIIKNDSTLENLYIKINELLKNIQLDSNHDKN